MAATARSAPRLQRRGRSIGADKNLVPFLAAYAMLGGGAVAGVMPRAQRRRPATLGDAQQLANHKVSTWRARSLRVPCAVWWISFCAIHRFLACAAGLAPKLVDGARAYPPYN